MPRIVYLIFGCLFVGLGFIGAFLPLLPTAKILSTAMMVVSMAIMLAVTDLSVWTYGGIAAVLTLVSLYILSRPGSPPDRS